MSTVSSVGCLGGFSGTGGSNDFEEGASDHVTLHALHVGHRYPQISTATRLIGVAFFSPTFGNMGPTCLRYTTIIKTMPFFDRTKNYIYNGAGSLDIDFAEKMVAQLAQLRILQWFNDV